MKFFFGALGIALLLCCCETDKDYTLVANETNTAGVKHTVTYKDALPVSILYETFHGSGSRDTTYVDSVLRSEITSIKYNNDDRTVLLTRSVDSEQRDFRKYYFNDDNLLVKITRFDNNREYITDSVSYDYTSRKAFYYDVINKHVFELMYHNSRNVIETEVEKRISDQHVYRTFYYYYDASQNPFLANLDEDEQLFGCFNYRAIGLFWNNASRPLFSSANNVQSFKEVTTTEERNGLFEYQYRHGLPTVQFGNSGVIYYHYAHATVSE